MSTETEPGEAICRTCLAPIWNEGGTVGHVKRAEGWSDRIERGGDSLVCFKARDYRHVPVSEREAAIYVRGYERGRAAKDAELDRLRGAIREYADSRGVHVGDEDDQWYAGYRQAQRESLWDAQAFANLTLGVPADGEARA